LDAPLCGRVASAPKDADWIEGDLFVVWRWARSVVQMLNNVDERRAKDNMMRRCAIAMYETRGRTQRSKNFEVPT
jgi:hypothetical protein